MALKLFTPRKSKDVVLRHIAMMTTRQLRENFMTQHIWPYEIYPGFAKVNEERKRRGEWYATGEGIKSFQSRVLSSVDGNESIMISYNNYLRFAEMGVGAGRPFDVVQHERKAHYSRRYTAKWYAGDGRTHRPAIMMEIRHAQGLMERYFADFYGREVTTEVINVFGGIDNLNLVL